MASEPRSPMAGTINKQEWAVEMNTSSLGCKIHMVPKSHPLAFSSEVFKERNDQKAVSQNKKKWDSHFLKTHITALFKFLRAH